MDEDPTAEDQATIEASQRVKIGYERRHGLMGSLRKPIQSIAGSLRAVTPLPDEAACPRCGYYDTSHPEVLKELTRRDPSNELLEWAKCRCQDEVAKKERDEIMRRTQANLPHSETPRRFSNFKPVPGAQQALEAAKRFAQGGGPACLVLGGVTGSGKSHLLEAIGRHVLDDSATVRYETASDFLDRLRHTYDGDSDMDILEMTAWYQGHSFLLLDELGAEAAKDWATERLTALVDERLRMGKRLAVATNLTRDKMAERMGDRLASRLFQTNAALGEVKLVVMTAGDYRSRTGETW